MLICSFDFLRFARITRFTLTFHPGIPISNLNRCFPFSSVLCVTMFPAGAVRASQGFRLRQTGLSLSRPHGPLRCFGGGAFRPLCMSTLAQSSSLARSPMYVFLSKSS